MIKQLLKPVDALTDGFSVEVKHENQVLLNSTNVTSFIIEDDKSSEVKKFQKRQGIIVGDIQLMIRYEDGKEITELPNIYPIPNAPNWFNGFCNLHGALIPVFDLALYLTQNQRNQVSKDVSDTIKKRNSMLIVLGHGEDSTGFIIEDLPKRMEFQSKDMLANELIPDRLKNLVKGVFSQGGNFWFDLNLPNLIKELEHAVSV